MDKKEDENIINEILKEKIFSLDHIRAIYILFSNLCAESELKLTRSSLLNFFNRLSQITNMKYDEEKIDLFHLQIDINKDGIITFGDFLLFITTIIKLSYNELYMKKGINLLSGLSLSQDRKFFIDITSSVFSNIINYVGGNSLTLTNLNPFSYYDLSLKYIPFYKFYCNYKNNINMSNFYNSQKKFNEFNQMILNFTDVGFVNELQKLLNSQITSEYYKGLALFKKSIKPLNYLNSEMLIIFFNKNIFIFLSVILNINILNKILMIFSLINNNKENEISSSNIISQDILYVFLVILRRILNIFVMLNETFSFCSEQKNRYMYNFIKEESNNFNELNIFIANKILNPLSENFNYFYEICQMKVKQFYDNEKKVKFVMYQLILMTSRIKLEYFNYFINNTNYLTWLITDVKNNLNVDKISDINYITLENVIFNCINIIDIYLKYENNNIDTIKTLARNIYVNILFIVNSIKDIIFTEKNKFSLLSEINTNSIIKNIFENNSKKNNESSLSIKSKFICLLGLLNCINVNIDEINNINKDIKEFDNRKFILQIYTEEFKTKQSELTLPFCFYLKSLILNNKNILSIITELDIVNNFYNYYSSNANNNLVSLSHFFDFCELILQNTEPQILINNSNIINELILIINKIIAENNNFKLLDDFEIKNKIIYILSQISDLNDVCINEKIINIKNIFSIIISYMTSNFYYIEEMNYINKKNIVFNIHLLEHGINIINNIIITNTNSTEKILEQFNIDNIEALVNLFDKISLLWNSEDKTLNIDTEEIIKNKYIFNKYKELPKKNILIQILLILENLLDYKDKIKVINNNLEEIFNYINDIDINIRLKLRELKINDEELLNTPTLILYTQTDEEIQQNLKSRFDMEIDGLTFFNFINMIKEGYQSDVELSYNILVENNTITRYIKQEKDFEIFIQEMTELYKNKPNKDNIIEADIHVELKDEKAKIKGKCINCGKETEIKLNIDKKKLEEINDFSKIENLEQFNDIINKANQNQLCKECKNLILEHAKNQINIENSKNNINNLSGVNLNNLNISNNNPHNTYQNILANTQILNDSIMNNTQLNNSILNASLLNNSFLNNNILSNSLLNRTINTGIGYNNNINNQSNINNQNNSIQGFNGINNISAINPINLTTPRRDSSFLTPSLINSNNFNNTFSANLSNYKVIRTNNFQ